MNENEAKARWICCPMCDREKCQYGAKDCDAYNWLKKKREKENEQS